ncbi:MAG: hypothetical protein QOI31_1430 [Solirubrobacterales bacterium]|nr:hypothetical protein [Solirubrobacterales bacterium]
MSRDHGYFPPGSMLRRVQHERAVGLLYGQRALGIGALDPRNFMGTLLHDRSADRPFHRLVATAKMFEAIFFGSRDKADRILAAVHGMHSNVKGTLPNDAGRFKAGTPYAAHDPELMLWTIAPAADSAVHFYELFVRKLSESERDEFWADYVSFGELFGMPASVAPTSWRDLREYVDLKINGPDAHLTEEAKVIGRAVMLEIPTSASRRAPMQAHNLVMRGSLPPRVRELYGIRWTSADAFAFRGVVAAARAARPVTPQAVRRGSCVAQFDDVAAAERKRIANGWTSPVEVPRAAQA